MDNKKEKRKSSLVDKVLWVTIGSAICYSVLFLLFLKFNVALTPLLTILTIGFGGVVGGLIGKRVDEKISMKTNDFKFSKVYEDDLEKDDELSCDEKREQLKVIKGSGTNYSYQYSKECKPKLEIVNHRDEVKKEKRR